MGHLHRDVVDDVHEMEDRVAVGAHDDEVLLLGPLDPARIASSITCGSPEILKYRAPSFS